MSYSGARRRPHGGGSGGSGGRRHAREPETAEEAWRIKFQDSVAGKRRGACRYSNWHGMAEVPESLVDYAPGGRYFTEQPPMPPMTAEFARDWAGEGSSRGGARAEEEPAGEEEDPALLEALAASKAEYADAQEAERQEEARAIAAVEEFKAQERARTSAGVVILDD